MNQGDVYFDPEENRLVVHWPGSPPRWSSVAEWEIGYRMKGGVGVAVNGRVSKAQRARLVLVGNIFGRGELELGRLVVQLVEALDCYAAPGLDVRDALEAARRSGFTVPSDGPRSTQLIKVTAALT